MIKYRSTIQYLGTRYAGWQSQKNQPTIQATIQAAIERVTREVVSVVGAGRTDAGVHALGQVAHFRLENPVEPFRLQRALNGVLPGDVRIIRLTTTRPSFHAQKDAVKKRYSYRFYNGPVLSPFLSGSVYHVLSPLDPDRMREAAEGLLGRRDFKAFAAASSTVRDHHRTVFLSRLAAHGRHLRYDIEADGFLHHMVRNIVGTLLQIGTGKRPPSDIFDILASRDRRRAGPTAPPQGLFLVRVWYPVSPESGIVVSGETTL
jgi:tRNA pseudouridine38-40 synthase